MPSNSCPFRLQRSDKTSPEYRIVVSLASWTQTPTCASPCPAAYEVLSEPEKRRIYDRYGEEGLKEHEGRGGRGGGGGAQDIFSQCAFDRSLWQLPLDLCTTLLSSSMNLLQPAVRSVRR